MESQGLPARTGQLEQDGWNKKAGQDSHDRASGTGRPGQDGQNMTLSHCTSCYFMPGTKCFGPSLGI
jgi:hypothetical protein